MATNHEVGKWVIDAIQATGIDIGKLVDKQPDLVEQLMENPEQLSGEELNTLLLEAEALAEDQDLGLHLARYSDLRSMGLYGYLLLNGNTLGDVLELADRYYATLYRTAKIVFSVNAKTATLEYKLLVPSKLSPRHDNEWTLGVFIYLIRSITYDDWQPLNVTFTHSTPANTTEVHRLFGDKILFDQPQSRIVIDANLLNIPVNDADPNLLQIVREKANRLLSSYNSSDSLESHIRLLIMKDIGQSNVSADSIARQLNMSRSTLQRRLEGSSHNFRALREGVVLDLAKKALAETNSSVSNIALMVGYSELSAFDRSFVRLTGTTPREYRKAARESEHA